MAGFRQSDQVELEVKGSCDKVFEAVVESARAAGTIKQTNPNMGFVSVKIPLRMFPPSNPVNLKITVKSKDDETCVICFSADSLDGVVGLGSCGKAIDRIVDELASRI